MRIVKAAGRTTRSALHRMGIEAVRHGRSPRPLTLYRYQLPGSLEWADRGGRLEVAVGKMTTAAGFGFGAQGWHPHVETLRWAIEPRGGHDPPDPLDSPLARLYAAFQPTTVQEAVFDDKVEPLPGLAGVPLVRGQLRELWNPFGPRRHTAGAARLDRPGLYWGPAERADVVREIDRLLVLYRGIERAGLQDAGPGKHALSGYLLARGEDYRFVVHEGHHRAACLTALGYATAPVYLSPKSPPVVREERLGRWSRGRRPRYPEATARLLFARLFESTGRDKAARLGLLPPASPTPGPRGPRATDGP